MTKKEAIIKSIVQYLDAILEIETLKNNVKLIKDLKFVKDEVFRLLDEFDEKCNVENTDIEIINDYIKIVGYIQNNDEEENIVLNDLKLYALILKYIIEQK